MTQYQAYFQAAVAKAVGQRGELVPESFGTCPCGEPAVAGQSWATEWFDRIGLTERVIITRLCADHKARKTSFTPAEDCSKRGCGPNHCEWPLCRPPDSRT